jgi:hypothetical protein
LSAKLCFEYAVIKTARFRIQRSRSRASGLLAFPSWSLGTRVKAGRGYISVYG